VVVRLVPPRPVLALPLAPVRFVVARPPPVALSATGGPFPAG
jgi:hypothetical protein